MFTFSDIYRVTQHYELEVQGVAAENLHKENLNSLIQLDFRH